MHFEGSKLLSGLLVVALMAPAPLVFAAGGETPGTPGIQASGQRATQAMVLQSTPTAAVAAAMVAPRTLPRTGKALKQSTGGGSAAMVMGLVGMAAGLAGTYYVVKTMRETTKIPTTPVDGLR